MAEALWNSLFGSKSTLKVKITSAKNLRDADWGPFGGSSDPYVRIRIVDDDDHNKEIAVAKTKVLNNTTDPVWNQEFTFSNLEHPGAYTIKLNVLDKDFLTRDDPLGETSVDLGTLTAESGWQEFSDVWIDGFVFKSYLSFSLSTGGRWGSTPDEDDTLYVTVNEARGLRNADTGWISGKNDPYCIVSVLDAKGSTLGKFQTTVKDDAGTDVEWNESFTFENLKHPGASRLKLDVYDKDHFSPDDNLGEIIYHLGTLKCHPEPQEFTLALMKHPGKIRFTLDNKGQWGYGKHKGGVTAVCDCAIQ